MRRGWGVALLALTAALAPVVAAHSTASAVWSATWSAAQNTSQSEGFGAETVRMVVDSSVGGNQVRVHLNNEYATGTAVFGHVTIGLQQTGSTAVGTPVNVTFGGSLSLSLAPGASAYSDSTTLAVPAHTRLLVSLYLSPGQHSGVAPLHSLSNETEYNYWGADQSGSSVFAVSNTFSYTMYLDELDVSTAANSTVVAIGDSITDGANLATDTDTRWPDYLAARTAPQGLAVANEGVNGDEVTADNPGLPSVTARWPRDVLSVSGVRTVIEEGGINDLRLGVTASALEAAQSGLIAQAHAAGLRVFLTTITPCSGASSCGSAFEIQRQLYNTWVRAGTTADGYEDFDRAIGNGTAIATEYDSGDHLHANAAGSAVLADCVSLGLL